ncbi:YcxB family protein [Cohnella sp.]|uniref:YcxB family protein n=1 Tax=Cohnella sp. TaxID=1883426 RepID=UPI003703E2C3
MPEFFEVRTENRGKEYYRFNRFHLFRRKWYIAYLPSIVSGVLGLLAFLDGEPSPAYTLWAVAIVTPFLMLLLLALAGRRHLKTNKMYASMKNIYYRFDRSSLFCETVDPRLKTTLETDWDNVYRIYESKTSFYIYISNLQAFIIPKADIVTGRPNELSEMLEQLIGKRLRRC